MIISSSDLLRAGAFLLVLEATLVVYVGFWASLGIGSIAGAVVAFASLAGASTYFGWTITNVGLTVSVVVVFWVTAFVLDRMFSSAETLTLVYGYLAAALLHIGFQAVVYFLSVASSRN